jgi:hypothetical protein
MRSKLNICIYSWLFLLCHGSVISQEVQSDNDLIILSHKPLRYGVILFIEMDNFKSSFSNFKNELDSFNIDFMNESGNTESFELAGYYNRIYGGISFGYGDFDNEDHDSLDLEFKTRRYSIRTGYNLFNNKRIMVTPEIAIIWNKYQLKNFDKDRKIVLTKYLSERDLDIRMHQVTMFAGIKLSYKIYSKNKNSSDYYTLGLHGGYNLKLHNKPLIYSRGNRLVSESDITISNFNIGIHLSFNLEFLIYE